MNSWLFWVVLHRKTLVCDPAGPTDSHGLCNKYFNSAFENDFLENNYYNCLPTKLEAPLPDNYTMDIWKKDESMKNSFFLNI